MRRRGLLEWGFLAVLATSVSLAAEPTVRIMPLGDSITWGCCLRIEGGYRTRLYNLLAGAGYNVDFVGNQTINSNNPLLPDPDHEGYNGYQIQDIHESIKDWLDAIDDPDVILLLLGTNDFGHENDIDHAKDRLESLIVDIATLRPHAKIIVANLLLRTDNTTYNQQIELLFNPYVPQIVDRQSALGRQVSFVDMRPGIGASDLDDGLHPNLSGFEKMADKWYTGITSVISPAGTSDAPAVERAKARVDLKHVVVTFSKPVEDAAANVLNFSLTGGLTVLQAELHPITKRSVTLTTSPQSPGAVYTVTVRNVRDRTPEHHMIGAEAACTFQSGPIAEAAPYKLVYSLNIRKQSDFNARAVEYERDYHSSAGDFSRIAYYLELKPVGGAPTQYIWTSMDAFTGDASMLGVPSAQSGAFFQKPVANMNVQSSKAGIVNGAGFSGGTLEFWPGSYGPENLANVPGASGTVYDRGDSASAGAVGYGSMQVHNATTAQTLFAYNGWGGGGADVDLGIGNRPGSTPDWTFAQNAADYTARLLEVYVLPRTGTQSAPEVKTEPRNVTAAAGTPVTFEVVAAGQQPLAYQWQHNGATISGATASSYSLGSVQSSDGGGYRVTVSNGAGSATSATATLRVAQPPSMINGSFESGFTGWMTIGHQTIGSSPACQPTDGGKLAVFNGGATTPDAILLQSFATTAGQSHFLDFDVAAFGTGQKEQRLQMTIEGAGTLVTETFSIFAVGGGATEWLPKRYGFVANSETTTVSFRDHSPTTADVDLWLDNVRVSAHDAPVIVRQPSSATVQVGETVTLSVDAIGKATLVYQWSRDGVDVSGANGSSYTIGNAQASHSGKYRVTVGNGAGSILSEAAVLAVGSPGALLNGGFEPDYAGWTATGNQNVSWIGSGYRPTEGKHAVVFNWGQRPPNGVLSQTIATETGHLYRLEFDVGVYAFNQSEQRLLVTAVGNSTLLTRTVSVFGISGGQTLWAPKSYTFVADSLATTLRFTDQSPTTLALDLMLDRVRVTPIPVGTLQVNTSNPATGVNVTVSPADTLGYGSGTACFTRCYANGTTVTLTAPTSVNGNTFRKWLRDGVECGTTAAITVNVAADTTLTAVYASQIVGARVFYNNSAWDGENVAANASDDNAIATDKAPLLPGGTATFANYTSYSRGLNGIMIDVSSLPGTPLAADFTFKMGNDNTPGTWAPGPTPAAVGVRLDAGIGGSDRIGLTWGDNAVKKQWLQVTILATDRTGLGAPYVFYFGNAIGETGTFPEEAKVDAVDQLGTRANQRTLLNPAPVDFAFDFDRDKKVDAVDQLIARANQTTALNDLNLIDLSGVGLTALTADPDLWLRDGPQGRLSIESSAIRTLTESLAPGLGGLSIQPDASDGLVLHFVSDASQLYRLQSTERLGAGSWKDIEVSGPVVRQGLSHWTVPVAGETSHRFFRLVPEDQTQPTGNLTWPTER